MICFLLQTPIFVAHKKEGHSAVLEQDRNLTSDSKPGKPQGPYDSKGQLEQLQAILQFFDKHLKDGIEG